MQYEVMFFTSKLYTHTQFNEEHNHEFDQEPYEEGFLVDIETGEVLEVYPDDLYETVPYQHPDIEYKTPSNRSIYASRDLQELRDKCHKNRIDASSTERITVSEKVFDIISGSLGDFNINQLQRAMTLAKHIDRRNVAIMSKDKLCEVINVTPKNLARELDKLTDNGYLKVFEPNGKRHPTRLIAFNPHIFWKGDIGLHDAYVKKCLQNKNPWYQVDQ